MDRLFHKAPGEMGEGAKKRPIKSKGVVGVSNAETHYPDPDTDVGAVLYKKEGAQIKPMLPDVPAGMYLVIVALKNLGFFFVL